MENTYLFSLMDFFAALRWEGRKTKISTSMGNFTPLSVERRLGRVTFDSSLLVGDIAVRATFNYLSKVISSGVCSYNK